MFGIKGRDTFNKPHSTLEEKVITAGKIWMKIFPFVIIGFMVLVIIILSYVWYTYLYDKDVTQEQKNEYILQKTRSVIFKREQFDNAVTAIEEREARYKQERKEYNDIFYPKVEEYYIEEDELKNENNEDIGDL